MKEIKRFHEGGYGTSEMKQSGYGDWVLYGDHAEIVSAKNALIAELERGAVGGSLMEREMHHSEVMGRMMQEINALQEQVRALAAEANYLRNEIKQHSTSVHFCEVCGKDDPCKTDDVCFSLNHPLPDTDAVIREIRAQAVESYANYSDECYGTHDKSGEDARVYAARIRSGEQP